MALIACIECHQQISSTAKRCPHCGGETVLSKAAAFRNVHPKGAPAAGVAMLIGLVLLALIAWIVAAELFGGG